MKLFQTLALKLIKDIFVTLATFLTQLKKLYENIEVIRVCISSKKVSSVDKNDMFSFESITADDISQQIDCLDINKATQESDTLTKLVKRIDNLIVDYLRENFSNCFEKGTFSNDFKKAVIYPTHRKDCKTDKSNYRPIRILPNLSKILERLLHDRMYIYFSIFLPRYQ